MILGENPKIQPENAKNRLKIVLKAPQNRSQTTLPVKAGRRPAEKFAFWPDMSTFYQHFGANLPTPNINFLYFTLLYIGPTSTWEGGFNTLGDPSA